MGLETGTYLSDLNASNPAPTDGLNQADDHIRWIKSAVKTTFPNFAAALNSTPAAIDAAVTAMNGGAASLTSLALGAGTVAAPAVVLAGDTGTGLWRPAANQLGVAFAGVNKITASATNVDVPAMTIAGVTPGFVPIGGVLIWPYGTVPTNFIWANGQLIPRTGWGAALFTLWGTFFGIGDGSTTFATPNYCEVALVGAYGMGGAGARGLMPSSYTLGAVGGEATHVLTTPETPNHNHTAADSGHTHPFSWNTPLGFTNNGGSTQVAGGGNGTYGTYTYSGTTGSGNANITVGYTGGGGAHNNIQPSMGVGYIIRAQ